MPMFMSANHRYVESLQYLGTMFDLHLHNTVPMGWGKKNDLDRVGKGFVNLKIPV